MFSLLFHKDVFFPEGTEKAVLSIQKVMTNYFISEHFQKHLDNQINEDRSHTYLKTAVEKTLRQMIDKNRIERKPFEVELSKSYKTFGVSNWVVTKYCIRIPYDKNSDLVVVIRPQWDSKNKCYKADKNMVVTAWINHKTDAHFTLDGSKYCSKERWLNI